MPNCPNPTPDEQYVDHTVDFDVDLPSSPTDDSKSNSPQADPDFPPDVEPGLQEHEFPDPAEPRRKIGGSLWPGYGRTTPKEKLPN